MNGLLTWGNTDEPSNTQNGFSRARERRGDWFGPAVVAAIGIRGHGCGTHDRASIRCFRRAPRGNSLTAYVFTARPYFDAARRICRFRILNGSNARSYRLAFSQGSQLLGYYLIGTDGGLLEQPRKARETFIGAAQRLDPVASFPIQSRGCMRHVVLSYAWVCALRTVTLPYISFPRRLRRGVALYRQRLRCCACNLRHGFSS